MPCMPFAARATASQAGKKTPAGIVETGPRQIDQGCKPHKSDGDTTMLKIIALVLALSAAGVLLLAAFRPDTFRVQRTVIVQAPAERVHPLINDLRRFNAWNPYEKKDPNLVGAYSGPASGPGASYAFTGNKEVGKGAIRITSSERDVVRMSLTMLEPFEAENRVEFRLEPREGATQVTWALEGRVPYFAKIIHLFFDMDSMVGKDFEAGLAGLKKLAEA